MPNTDHAQPGTWVAVLTGYAAGSYRATVHTVDRRTATQIVLTNGDRFRIADGRIVGDAHSATELRPYNDRHVVDARVRGIARETTHEIDNYQRLERNRSPWEGMGADTVADRLNKIAAAVAFAVDAVAEIRRHQATGTTPATIIDNEDED
jgi:hypothetical protein